MNKYILIILLNLIVIQFSNAQVFQPKGKIGGQFLDIVNFHSVDKKLYKKRSEQQRNAQIEFGLRNLFKSGKVIYNCEASEYIGKIADKLLKNNPNIRKELNIYILNSTDIQAVTYFNGMILIHMGLLANIKTESQLAFILAHEISHYQLNHSYESYKQPNLSKKKIAKSNGLYEEYIYNSLKYSREKEFEADKNGLKLFLESEYASSEVINVLDVFKFANYPIENKLILRESFETPFFKISPLVFPDTASNMISLEDMNDSLSTHPNLQKRTDQIKNGLPSKNLNGPLYVVDENLFKRIKKEARIQLSNLYINEYYYLNAFYNSYVLLEDDPNNKELKLVQLKALFFIQKYLNQYYKSSITVSVKKIKGELQKLHSFFSKAQKDDMNAFVLRLSWRLRSQLQNDSDAIKFSNLIIKEFGKYVSKDIAHFKPISEYSDTLFIHNYEFNKSPNKPTKSGLKSLVRKSDYPHYSISHFAMSDFIDDNNFRQIFQEQISQIDSSGSNEAEKEYNEEDESIEDLFDKKRSHFSKKVKPLVEEAVTNLIVFDVNNFYIDYRKEEVSDYLKVNNKHNQLLDLLKETGKLNGVNLIFLNPNEITEDDSAIYSERVFLNHWLFERFFNINIDYLSSREKQIIEKIIKKYNTKNICFINSQSWIFNKLVIIDLPLFISSFILPPLPIYFLYKMINPLKTSIMYIPIFNLENGKIIYEHKKIFNDVNSIDYLRSEFYNFFHIISKNAYQ